MSDSSATHDPFLQKEPFPILGGPWPIVGRLKPVPLKLPKKAMPYTMLETTFVKQSIILKNLSFENHVKAFYPGKN